MPVVPTYESQVTLRPHDAGTLSSVDTSGMLPSTAPDFSRMSAAALAFQKKMDTARVEELQTAMDQYATEQAYGANGYTKLLGEAALAQDGNGQGLPQRVMTDYDKHFEKLCSEKKLTPNQMRMANEMIGKRRNATYASALEHWAGQGKRFVLNGADNKLSVAISKAAYTGESDNEAKKTFDGIDEAVEYKAQVNGFTGDSEEAKAFRQRLKTESNTQALVSMVNGLLAKAEDDPKYATRAKKVLDKYANRVTGTAALELYKRVTSYTDQAGIDSEASSIMSSEAVTGSSGAAYGAAVVSGGKATPQTLAEVSGQAFYEKSISAPRHYNENGTVVGTNKGNNIGVGYGNTEEIKKWAGETFDKDKFASDPAYNNALCGAYCDSLLKDYAGDYTQAAAAYYSSKKDVEDAKQKSLKETGSGINWFSYLDKNVQRLAQKAVSKWESQVDGVRRDEKGNVISVFSPEYAKARTMKSYQEIEKLVLSKSPRAGVNPVYRQRLVNEVWRREAIAQQDYERTQATNIARAREAIWEAQGNMTKVSKSVMAQLNPAEQLEMMDFATRVANKSNPVDYEITSKYLSDRSLLAALSKEQFETLCMTKFGKFADDARKMYYGAHAEANIAAQAKGIRNAQANAGYQDATYWVDPSIVKGILPSYYQKAVNLDAPDMKYTIVAVAKALSEKYQREGVKPEKNRVSLDVAQLVQKNFYQLGDEEKNIFDLKAKDLPSKGDTSAREVLNALTKDYFGIKRDPNTGELNQVFKEILMNKTFEFRSLPTYKQHLNEAIYNTVAQQLGASQKEIDNYAPRIVRQYLIESMRRK